MGPKTRPKILVLVLINFSHSSMSAMRGTSTTRAWGNVSRLSAALMQKREQETILPSKQTMERFSKISIALRIIQSVSNCSWVKFWVVS